MTNVWLEEENDSSCVYFLHGETFLILSFYFLYFLHMIQVLWTRLYFSLFPSDYLSLLSLLDF